MSDSGHRLYYRKNGSVIGIPLYTTTGDFYNYNGLPIRVGGSVLFAPIGLPGDLFASDLHIRKNGSINIAATLAIPPDQGLTQGGWSESYGGSTDRSTWVYNNYFYVPNSRNVAINSVLNGWNSSSTAANWCWARWHVYLDGSDISGELYKTSNANGNFSWQAVNGNYWLGAGQHNLQLYVSSHASSGDSQADGVNSWVNSIRV